MSDSPSTRQSLLLQIRDLQNDTAWAQFAEAYAPLVYRFARRHGLQDADAADITQDVLRSVVRSAGEFVYDPSRGRFRTWLYTVSRNKILNHLAKAKNTVQAVADTGTWRQVQEQPGLQSEDLSQWDWEYERRMFTWACERVRDEFRQSTWQAFWLTAVENQTPAQVAMQLQLSVGAVYVAKSRVLAALKAEVQRLTGEDEVGS